MATKTKTSSHYYSPNRLGSDPNSNRKAQAIDFKIKYKTELCKNFSKGICEFGSSCAFAHGTHELRKGDKICYQYSEYGYCVYGEKCQFTHVDKALSTIDTLSKHSSEEEKPELPLFIDLESRNKYI